MADLDDPNSIIEFEQSYAMLTEWYYRSRLRARREDIFAGMLSAEFLVLDGASLATVGIVQGFQRDRYRRRAHRTRAE